MKYKFIQNLGINAMNARITEGVVNVKQHIRNVHGVV